MSDDETSGNIADAILTSSSRSLDEPPAETNLSDSQQMALALIPIFTGLLSAWGSANIMLMVYKVDKRSRNCYNRIMFGLSVSDLISSLVLSMQSFLLPSDTSPRIWAFGSDATCTAMGFFQQLSTGSILYSAMLSFVYLLTIKYSMSEEILANIYEPWMHAISIGFPIATALLGVALEMYAEVAVGPFCWFAAGDRPALMAYLVGGIPGFLSLLLVIINNLLVYCHVKWTTNKTAKHARAHSVATSIITTTTTTIGPPPPGFELPPLIAEKSIRSSSTGSNQSNESNFSNESGTTDQQLQAASLRRREELREMQREEARLQSLQDRSNHRVRAVAIQGLLYVAAFMLCYVPLFAVRITASALSIPMENEATLFPLLLVQAIFWPLQGFFNFIIYSRNPSSYLREMEIDA